MFKFANPEFLYGLLILPALLLIYLWLLYARKRALKRFGYLPVVQQMMPLSSVGRRTVKFVILSLSLTSAIFALARPQFGSKLETVKRKGIELIIALDVSNSMMAEDLKPNRLENAKRAISKLVDKLENDKIGLIVFAGDAYVQVPITVDYTATKMFLQTAGPGMVTKQGTDLGKAIELASKSFTPESQMSKAMIIITDGENNETGEIEAATEAAKKGIVIHTMGIGLQDGVPIPIGTNNYMKEEDGSIHVSKLNETLLKQVSKAGNGSYVHSMNIVDGLNTLFDKISKLEKSELESKTFSEYDDKFQYLAALSLLLLLLDLLLLERKNRKLKNVSIFNAKFFDVEKK